MEPDVSVAVAFAGGLAAFLSPCILPLVPAYLFFLAGESVREADSPRRVPVILTASGRGVLAKALLFVIGFTGVYVVLGVLIGAAATFLFRWRRAVMHLAGAAVICFGLLLLAQAFFERHDFLLRRFPGLYRLFASRGPEVRTAQRGSYAGALAMGMAFSLAWGPCAGPIAGSIAAYASVWGDVAKAAQLSIAFSAGLAVPFLLSAVFIDRLSVYVRKLSRFAALTRVAAGLLLVLLGLVVFTDSLWRIGLVFL
jgi:cytochrome c-type biogenesis protein